MLMTLASCFAISCFVIFILTLLRMPKHATYGKKLLAGKAVNFAKLFGCHHTCLAALGFTVAVISLSGRAAADRTHRTAVLCVIIQCGHFHRTLVNWLCANVQVFAEVGFDGFRRVVVALAAIAAACAKVHGLPASGRAYDVSYVQVVAVNLHLITAPLRR